ncbi:hypothetical protein [Nonomuraea soli]|uniref:SH3 domain-containing protein n=1 Tax=Nonomuraea soli TaxID=1032476 RepID=A0A7W0HSB0_9ACTN|nr:hypothetical protein [Nonomuraea soli]MBA2893859.1 hypothetical protein [Nonomuraea soli]
MKKTLAILVAGGAVATMALVAAPAAQAAAPPQCQAPKVADRDKGRATMRGTFNLKAGPYAGPRCSTVGKARKGQVLEFFCWVTNDYGTHWVFAHVKGTKKYGWMSIDNLRTFRDTNNVREGC